MNPAAAIIHDAGLELFEADSHLVTAEGAQPEDAVKLHRLSLECLHTARRKIEQAERAIEISLFEKPSR